jgi:hypothetical protein
LLQFLISNNFKNCVTFSTYPIASAASEHLIC